MSSWTPHDGKQDAPVTFETLSKQMHDLISGIDRVIEERNSLRAATRQKTPIEVFKCSNPDCDAIWSEDPHGHCPACIKADGGGWSCRTIRVLALSQALARA